MTEFIDPGRLRTELALEQNFAMPDGLGGWVEHWTEVATVFAMIEPISAQSLSGADQTRQTLSHRVTIRAREGVACGMRLSGKGRIFDIVTVHDPDETGRYLICRTMEAKP